MERTELAWAAGFWDGEGSIYLTGALSRATRQPQGRVNQASTTGVPQVLLRFRSAVSVGVISGPVMEEGKEPLFRWTLSNRAGLLAVYDALLPWLGSVKQRQFEQVIGLEHGHRAPALFDRAKELAWAAGLFDGEGSTYLDKHNTHPGYFRLEAGITQSDREDIPFVLRRFAEIVRVGKIYGPYPAPPGHAPVYRWKAHRAAEIVAMIDELKPWLSDVKRAQADQAISVVSAQAPLARGNPAWGNRKTHCVNRHEYATARIRPFRGRGKNTEAPRASHQCLACVRDSARRKRKQKSRGIDPRLSREHSAR